MTLEYRQKGKFSFLACPSWEEEGLCHGFIGASADFSSTQYQLWEAPFLDAFGARALFLPEQIHSASVIDLRQEEKLKTYKTQYNFAKGDALIVARQEHGKGKQVAFGIRTADCLPILLKNDENIALLHAGWRGLALGIIEAVIGVLGRQFKLSALIGPAASVERYEVEYEVIEAIGERAKFVALEGAQSQQYFLDLVGTASGILRSNIPGIEIVSSDVCTISDNSFHSFRREGFPPKSNLTFLIL